MIHIAKVAAEPEFVRPDGKPCAIATVYRAANPGLRSVSGKRVRLRTIRLPSGTYCRRSDIDRFVAELNDGNVSADSAAIAQQHDQANRFLDAAGL